MQSKKQEGEDMNIQVSNGVDELPSASVAYLEYGKEPPKD